MINTQFILNQIMNNPQMQNNPVMQNAFKLYQSGDNKGLWDLCNNVCKSNGTSVDEIRKKYGI